MALRALKILDKAVLVLELVFAAIFLKVSTSISLQISTTL